MSGIRWRATSRELNRFWVPTFSGSARMSTDGIEAAIEQLATLRAESTRIGIERAFLPADAESALRKGLPEMEFIEAQLPLERLRAVKTPQELESLRKASDLVVDSMLAVIAGARARRDQARLVEALRREEVNRGLTFEYCLITAGTSLNRAPSDQILREGDILSLDSGGNYNGYIGDLCRMAIFGEPDAELEDLLGEVDAIQQAARRPIRHGARGGDIYAAAEELTRASPHGNSLEFVAHGMGLISHEAPRLTNRGPVPYPAYDADLAAAERNGPVDRDDDPSPAPRLHQARGHGRGDRKRLAKGSATGAGDGIDAARASAARVSPISPRTLERVKGTKLASLIVRRCSYIFMFLNR